MRIKSSCVQMWHMYKIRATRSGKPNNKPSPIRAYRGSIIGYTANLYERDDLQ